MPKVYSFDIFDTVFVRKVALASDVFRLVGERLAARSARPEISGRFVEDFISARILAESAARKALGQREDCMIQSIWSELAQLMPNVVAQSDFSIELQCDEDELMVNPVIASRIANHRARGERVIFISDIYYPHEVVFRWLSKAGLCDSTQDLYVSSEIGLLKHTGNLFKHVLEREAINPADLHHTGDNVTSDLTRPNKLGISAEHYPHTRLDPVERNVQEVGRPCLFGSRLAASMRFARLQDGASRNGDEVTAFLGPMAVVIALWTANLAKLSQAQRVYFIARDGYVPWRAATEMGASLDGLDIRYIRLSRNSLIAAIPKLGEFGAFWIKQSWAELSASEIVTRLGYEWSDVASAMSQHSPPVDPNQRLADDTAIAALVAAIDCAVLPDDRRMALDDRRRRVCGYLQQEGMFDGTPFIVFDVGWFLNLQAAFKSILDANGEHGFVGGGYLALSHGRVAEAIAGPAWAMFHQRPYCLDLPSDANFVFDRRILVEHLMGLAPHGSAAGYAEASDGSLHATEGPISAQRQLVVGQLSDSIAAFARIVSPAIGTPEVGSETLVRIADALLRHFVANANQHDISALSQLYAETDGKHTRAMTLPEPWQVVTALGQIVPYRLRERWQMSHGPTLWPEMAQSRAGAVAKGILGGIGLARKLAKRIVGSRR